MRIAFALYGQMAGVIERDGGRMTLRYRPEHLQRRNATPLSLSMPLSTSTYPTRPIEAYLRGLLPDHDEVRARWAAKAGVRPGNTLGLVASVGIDVSGGAIFAPEEQIEDTLARPGTLTPASEADIAARLRRVRQDDAAWQDDEEDEHWSLAGAQSKFTLARSAGDDASGNGEGWAFAEGSAPSTHIVKPGIGRIRAQALSEHVSMRALALAGLPVAETQYLTFEDQDAIVVTRFDRRVTSRGTGAGSVARIHQEDLLQAFALDPRRKYEADGGPGVQRIADLLRSVAGPEAVQRFARYVIANQILGAPDAHGKNYGLLLIGSRVQLAPLYDVATGLIPNAVGQLRYGKGAMSIGGERRFGDLQRSHWEKFARALGLAPGQVIDWVDELTGSIPPAFQHAAEETAAPDADFLAGVVAANIAAVAQQTRDSLITTAGGQIASEVNSRRRHGRLLIPFLQTLPGQQHASTEAGDDGPTIAEQGMSDIDHSRLPDQDQPWGA